MYKNTNVKKKKKNIEKYKKLNAKHFKKVLIKVFLQFFKFF